MESIKIVCQNVNGMRDVSKRKQIFKYFRDFDVVMLQETHSISEDLVEWQMQWAGPAYLSHGTNYSRGVATLINPKLDVGKVGCDLDDNGRYVITELKIKGTNICICNIYAPNEDKPDFFRHLFECVEQSDHTNRLVCGDYNLVLNTSLDRKSSQYNNHQSAAYIQGILDEGYTEVWRVRNPTKKQYSWFQGRQQCARLDFAIVSDDFVNKVSKIEYKLGILSDHSLMALSISTEYPARGKGFWKQNSLHISNPKYQEGLLTVFEDFKNKCLECSASLRWEMLKLEITAYSRAYASQCSKEKHRHKQDVERTITYLDQ